MRTIRFKIGVNAWECKCGAIVATGRVCSCGARQINNVVEKKTCTKQIPPSSKDACGNRQVYRKLFIQRAK